jgi:hypothetical protein
VSQANIPDRIGMRPAIIVVAVIASAAATAHADPVETMRPEVQADLGLAVIGLGYEQPLGAHLAVMGEFHSTSTYFAPWFGAGDSVMGWGGEVRVTWFPHVGGRGLYVTPWLRIDRMTGSRDGADGHAFGFTAGGFVGWAFRLTPRLDLRLGVGALYMRYLLPTTNGATGIDTTFFGLDAIVGYRL